MTTTTTDRLHAIDRFPPPEPGADGDEVSRYLARRLSDKPTIHPSCRIHNSRLGGWTALGPECHMRDSTMGDYSYAAGHVAIVWADVGAFCSIAAQTRINPGNHAWWRVTQNHCTYRRAQYGFGDDDAEFFEWRAADRVHIGHDVWIGHGSTILPGARIETGAIIGAGAVVSKARPVGPYEVAVGVPARPVKKRFSDDVIEQLLAIGYWDWDRETLEARFDDLLDIDAFIEKYGTRA